MLITVGEQWVSSSLTAILIAVGSWPATRGAGGAGVPEAGGLAPS